MAERVFAMPDLGEGLEEGEIVDWLVAPGDDVALNQPLVEVETAKATVEIPRRSPVGVTTLHGAAGDAVAVGAPLVTFSVAEATPRAPPRVEVSGGGGATPAVRKLAKERGIDLATVTGTGPGGRVTVEDLRPLAGGWVTTSMGTPITPIRREIAKRLTEVAAIPQVTTFRTLDCTALEPFRRELDVSPLPVFVAALARTCADHPLINASWQDDGIHEHRSVHVGVAIDSERGLMVPVAPQRARDGHRGDRRRDPAPRRRHARWTSARRTTCGAPRSASATRALRLRGGHAAVEPGNAVTVAMGVIQPRALVVDGAVVARLACTLSLTFDHRVLDGATAGRALTDLVELLQDDERLRDLPR